MNIFVTVGTTKFDSLIRYLDSLPIINLHEITCQISKAATYIPKNFKYFDFSDQIDEYYKAADLVITHAGAGSIFRLLEFRKKIIIVPNMERSDKHQLDIARYMHDNNYACSIECLDNLSGAIARIAEYEYVPYIKENFFVASDIMKFIVNGK
jgi:beta-1,4-N-acetylglucosaminyltransferase